MPIKEKIQSALNQLSLFSSESIDKASLRHKLVMAYHNDTIQALELIIEKHSKNESLSSDLKLFLERNWSLIQGSCLSYTSIPESEVSQLIYLVAEQVYTYEKEHLEEDERLNRLNYLMPSLGLDSNSLLYPTLGTINKTHFSEEESQELAEITQWFQANGGLPQDETKVYLNEEDKALFYHMESLNTRLKSLTQKQSLSEADTLNKTIILEDLAKVQEKITDKLQVQYNLEQRFKRFASLSQKQKQYEAEKRFIKQGIYQEDRDDLTLVVSFEQIMKSHIENGFGDALISLTELTEEKEYWAYSSLRHDEQRYEYTQLTKEDGLIAKISFELERLAPDSDMYLQKKHQRSSYIEQAKKLQHLLEQIKNKELHRLSVHSAQSRALQETHKRLDKLKTDNNHLLGHLLTLRRRLKYSDAHGGKGTSADAASDAYLALIDFNEYYANGVLQVSCHLFCNF